MTMTQQVQKYKGHVVALIKGIKLSSMGEFKATIPSFNLCFESFIIISFLAVKEQ